MICEAIGKDPPVLDVVYTRSTQRGWSTEFFRGAKLRRCARRHGQRGFTERLALGSWQSASGRRSVRSAAKRLGKRWTARRRRKKHPPEADLGWPGRPNVFGKRVLSNREGHKQGPSRLRGAPRSKHTFNG